MNDDINILIEKLIQRDNQAFETIYYRTNKMIYSIIITIAKDEMVTEDLMQETYIKMIKSIHSFKRGKNFNTWLGTIARNLAIDYYRRNQKTITVDIQEEGQLLFSNQSVNEDIKAEALELLNHLNEDEQLIVTLRVVNELTFKEISEITQRPLGTVIWSYNNSISKLSKQYKGGLNNE